MVSLGVSNFTSFGILMKHRNCPCVVMIAGIDHDYRCALKVVHWLHVWRIGMSMLKSCRSIDWCWRWRTDDWRLDQTVVGFAWSAWPRRPVGLVLVEDAHAPYYVPLHRWDEHRPPRDLHVALWHQPSRVSSAKLNPHFGSFGSVGDAENKHRNFSFDISAGSWGQRTV